VPPVQFWLSHTLVLAAPDSTGALPVLYSPGTWLAVTCAACLPLFRIGGTDLRQCLARTSRQWVRASLALAAFMLLSELMLHADMTETLAVAIAATLGHSYALAAPSLGALSGFLTGSNAGGSAMMLPFQLRTADQLGLPELPFASAQNAAASAASLASPQRVVLAATALGIPGEEGALVRDALKIVAGVVIIITLGLVAWLGGFGALLA
jgi:lactate permease